MIQSLPEVLENIRSNRGDRERDFTDPRSIIDSLSRLSIMPRSDFIWVGRKKRADFDFQLRKVPFRPSEFCLDSI